jgi:xylulokinase
MAGSALFLGIDVSTTSAKAILVDETGHVKGTASTAIPLSTPRPLWSEQHPLDWWTATTQSIHDALANAGVAGSAVAAIGLTGQMHGLVTLDEHGDVLRPAILWNDQRTARECDEIRAIVGQERHIQITGNDALTGFTAPKILWMRNNEPDVYARIRHVLLPKDFVRLRLTDTYALDKADGSGTLLFDVAARNWSVDMLDALEIPSGWLPPVFEGPEITGRVSARGAMETGLQAEPFIEPQGRLHAFCHAVPGRWHLMGVMLSAAGSLQWYHDTLAPETSFDTLLAGTERVTPGSDGLLFLPYLSGERTPYPDPYARGAWVGLTLRHTRDHMTRALVEGVAYGLADSLDLLRQAGVTTVQEFRLSGGGARSPVWRQILADVLNVSLVTTEIDEGAAYGAALLAGVGVDAWATVDQACAGLPLAGRVDPEPDTAAFYARARQEYRALYPALKPSFDRLAGSR